MTTPANNTTPPPIPQVFDDQITFTIVAAVEMSQITSEIATAVGRAVQVAQIGPDVGFVPTTDHPAVLAVSPGSLLTSSQVQAVITAHQPVAGWGVPQYIKDYQALQNRLVNTPTSALSSADIELAVRNLVVRDASRPPSTS